MKVSPNAQNAGRDAVIRIFSPFFPHPRNEGALITISEQSRRLCELGHTVELIYWKGPDPESKVLDTEFKGIAVRRLGPVKKEQKGAFRILRSLLSRWSSAEMFFYPPSLASELDQLGPAALNIFNYSFAGPWLRSRTVRGKAIAVFHNLENELYRKRARSARFGPERWIHSINARKLRRHELELACYCAELWFNSSKDERDFSFLPGRGEVPLRVFAPFFSEAFLREKRALRKTPPPGAPVTVGFVGGLHFGPNQLSAQWIIEAVAPELRNLGFTGRLLIIGRDPPPRLVARAGAFDFIKMPGFLPTLDQYWAEVSLSLSPHIDGSGVRMKLLESLAVGVPVLTHRAALDQLKDDLRMHPQIYASDSPRAWAETIMSATALSKPTPEGDLALTSSPVWLESLLR